jgi:hypothetical protein
MAVPEGSSVSGTSLSLDLLDNKHLLLRHYGEAFVGVFREGSALYPPMDILTGTEGQLPAGKDRDGLAMAVQEKDVLFLVLPHIKRWPMRPVDLLGAMLTVDVSSGEAFGRWAAESIFMLKDSRATLLMATIGRKAAFAAKSLDDGNVGFRVLHSQDYGHFYATYASFRLAGARPSKLSTRLQELSRPLDVSPFTLAPLSESGDSGSESDDESSEDSGEEEISDDEDEDEDEDQRKRHAAIKERYLPLPPGSRPSPVSPLDDIMSRAFRKSLKSSSSYVSADASVEEIPVTIPIDKFPGNRTPPSPMLPMHQLRMPMITYVPRKPVVPCKAEEGGEEPEKQSAAGRSLFNRPLPAAGKPELTMEAAPDSGPEKMDIEIEVEHEKPMEGEAKSDGKKGCEKDEGGRPGPNEIFERRMRFSRDRLKSEQPSRRKAFPY